jgi:hypothetical protein
VWMPDCLMPLPTQTLMRPTGASDTNLAYREQMAIFTGPGPARLAGALESCRHSDIQSTFLDASNQISAISRTTNDHGNRRDSEAAQRIKERSAYFGTYEDNGGSKHTLPRPTSDTTSEAVAQEEVSV